LNLIFDYAKNLKTLQHFFSEETFSRIFTAFEQKIYWPGEIIINPNEEEKEQKYYYILSGSVDVYFNSTLISRINAGKTFGEYEFFT